MASLNVSLACWPGLTHAEAAACAARADGLVAEPALGPQTVEHVQIVPQSRGRLTEDTLDEIRAHLPRSRLRLHANVRVLPQHRIADLSGLHLHADWFRAAAAVSRAIDAPAYSAHAGKRSESTLDEMLDNARHVADLFDCPVAVEGHYLTSRNDFLVSNWDEYRHLFESGVPYALDLSHLNIVAEASGRVERCLVEEMLSCERLVEVHVSDNNGKADQHALCSRATWWTPLLRHLNPGAIVFTEGNQRRGDVAGAR